MLFSSICIMPPAFSCLPSLSLHMHCLPSYTSSMQGSRLKQQRAFIYRASCSVLNSALGAGIQYYFSAISPLVKRPASILSSRKISPVSPGLSISLVDKLFTSSLSDKELNDALLFQEIPALISGCVAEGVLASFCCCRASPKASLRRYVYTISCDYEDIKFVHLPSPVEKQFHHDKVCRMAPVLDAMHEERSSPVRNPQRVENVWW